MSDFMRPKCDDSGESSSSTKRKFYDLTEEKKAKRAKMQAEKIAAKKYAQQNRLKVIKVPLLETPSKREIFMNDSKCKISVCLDLSWILSMDVKDLSKIQKLIRWVYCSNNYAKSPLQVYLTKYSGPIREELQRRGTTPRWDFHYHEEHYLDVFPKEKLVYLSSNSENVLGRLEEDKVYIIGVLEGNRHCVNI